MMATGRWKQTRGKIRKMWGKLTRNPCEEFFGEQDIIEGKLEEFHARTSGSRGPLWPARSGFGYAARQRDLVA
jgi:uncharacterized protein YjbJ (UPF0337 family)